MPRSRTLMLIALASTSTSVKITDALSIEGTAFLSHQSDLVTRSPLSTPRESEALVQDGVGRAYGGQVLLRHDLTNGFFGWLSYSLVRSQRKDAGASSYRPFDFDQSVTSNFTSAFLPRSTTAPLYTTS